MISLMPTASTIIQLILSGSTRTARTMHKLVPDLFHIRTSVVPIRTELKASAYTAVRTGFKEIGLLHDVLLEGDMVGSTKLVPAWPSPECAKLVELYGSNDRITPVFVLYLYRSVSIFPLTSFTAIAYVN